MSEIRTPHTRVPRSNSRSRLRNRVSVFIAALFIAALWIASALPSLSQSRGPRMFISTPGVETAEAAPMPDTRTGVATLDLSDGRVMVTGGRNMNAESVRTAEMYDPETGAWAPIAPMLFKRQNHSATELNDGRILVVGGGAGSSANPEIYDPATNRWTMAGTMASPIENSGDQGYVTFLGGTLTPMADGRVLAYGANGDGAQIYDPDQDQWEWAENSNPTSIH